MNKWQKRINNRVNDMIQFTRHRTRNPDFSNTRIELRKIIKKFNKEGTETFLDDYPDN